MVEVQQVVIVLLIIAILFSVVSIVLNLYVFDLQPVRVGRAGVQAQDDSSNVRLIIERDTEGGG
ncbi:MAG TPA: hypothetical protein VJK51_05175 [Candidatus Nanoarchaeia archaeon]|nr:hypothetical protein [Candidatus Nanoarchaeia archaeon]